MPLTSNLKRRTEPVTLDDIKSAGFNVRLGIFDKDVSPEILETWNKYIPYSPKEIASLFGGLSPDDFQLEVAMPSGNIRFNVREPKEEGVFKALKTYSTRTYFLWDEEVEGKKVSFLDTVERKVEGGEITLPEEMKGRGSGLVLTRMCIALDIALGVQEDNFTSMLTNGGYVWAKAGYRLKNPGRELHLSHLLLAKIEFLRPFISRDTYNYAKVFARLSNDDDLINLVDISEDLIDSFTIDDFASEDSMLRESFREVLINQNFFHKDEIENIIGQTFESFEQAYKFSLESGKPLTIGRLLLNGAVWEGYINYNNDNHVSDLISRIGEIPMTSFTPNQSSVIKRDLALIV